MPKTFFPNPEGTIGFASQRVTLAMARYLNEKFEKLGMAINMNQWGFIYYIFKNDKLPVKEIPKKFLLSESEINEIVEEIQKKEWVSLKKNKQNEDILTLTLKGTAKIFQLIPVLGDALVFFRGDIKPQEMLITINVLNKIYHHIYPDEELYLLKAPPLFEREN